MARRRYRAVLIGNWHFPFDQANLPDLYGPLNDVSRLAELLSDPAHGLFLPEDVTVLAERESRTISAALEDLFNRAAKDEVLLIYYSGHGLRADDDGTLLLCGRDSRSDAKIASTVSSESINRMISLSAAAAVIIILDCCHSGAFKSGEMAGDLAGRGRFILASSRPKDRARDADHATGMSRFTSCIVQGILSSRLGGEDGCITLSDLYSHTYAAAAAVRQGLPQRKFDGTGDIPIARSLRVARAVPSFGLSRYAIDLQGLEQGEEMPKERIFVSGSPGWQVTTESPWVELEKHEDYFIASFRPLRAGSHRSNIDVYDPQTRGHLTVRIAIRINAAQPHPYATAKGHAAVEAPSPPWVTYPDAPRHENFETMWVRPKESWPRLLGKAGAWTLAVCSGFLTPFTSSMIVEASAGRSTVENQLGAGIFGIVLCGGLFYLAVWLLMRNWKTSLAYVIGVVSLGSALQGIAMILSMRVYGIVSALVWTSILIGSCVYLVRFYRAQGERSRASQDV